MSRPWKTLGRAYLADQMRDAKSHRVKAKAWLPLQTGGQGIADGVSRFHADLVILRKPRRMTWR
jgi:hypothetical protein